MKVLVTRCVGFIRSHLTERLLRDGFDVIGIDRSTDYYSRECDFLPAASNGASCFNHEGFMSTGVNSTQSVPTYGCFSSCSCDFTRDRAIRSRDQASLPNERSDSDDGIVFMSCGAGFIPATSNGVFSRGDYKELVNQ